jgi:hypothetical protein
VTGAGAWGREVECLEFIVVTNREKKKMSIYTVCFGVLVD